MWVQDLIVRYNLEKDYVYIYIDLFYLAQMYPGSIFKWLKCRKKLLGLLKLDALQDSIFKKDVLDLGGTKDDPSIRFLSSFFPSGTPGFSPKFMSSSTKSSKTTFVGENSRSSGRCRESSKWIHIFWKSSDESAKNYIVKAFILYALKHYYL